MFDKEFQFYPTPAPLIRKMITPFLEKNRRGEYGYGCFAEKMILDPSAGKGDILSYVDERVKSYNRPIYHAIEIQPDLQTIIRDKDYDVVGSNFLEFEENYFYDYILMNPPFKDGAKHLLHAIELGHNTKIACILNAETIRNPHTEERKLLMKKIEDLGSYEFYEEEFIEAERRTKVEIALVHLEIETAESDFKFDFEDVEFEKLDFDFDINSDGLARVDLIGNMNMRYEEVRKVYKELLYAQAKFGHFWELFLSGEQIYGDKQAMVPDKGTARQKYMKISMNMKQFMWRSVADKMDMQKYMSHKVRENFAKFIQQQSQMAFTKNNVEDFFLMIMNNRKNIWDQAVVDVFELLTKYTTENRHHVEGWRTNDKFKINRTVILPYGCEWGSSYDSADYRKTEGVKFNIPYSRQSEYSDIDKVMGYLAGHSVPEWTTIHSHLKHHFDKIGRLKTGVKFENTLSSGYFDIKFYKKGTLHLKFKDKKLWDLFNMTACAHLNWLPDNEKTAWEAEKKAKRDVKKKAEQEAMKPEALQIEAPIEVDEFSQIKMF